jgi:AbrB family looped-hinge helix DNA binding protein
MQSQTVLSLSYVFCINILCAQIFKLVFMWLTTRLLYYGFAVSFILKTSSTFSIWVTYMCSKYISNLDEKGRVVIPQSIRETLGLAIGEKLIISSDSNSIIIEPAHESKLLELQIGLSDSVGSLAKASSVLAQLGVDLVSTSSRSSKRGELAIWGVQCNQAGNSISQIKKALANVGAKVISARTI